MTVGADCHDSGMLTDTETEMLAFERAWWKHAGARDTAIRDRFGMTPTRYFQVLNALIDRPEALAADPLTVKRLLRLREARRAQRTGGAGRVDVSTNSIYSARSNTTEQDSI